MTCTPAGARSDHLVVEQVPVVERVFLLEKEAKTLGMASLHRESRRLLSRGRPDIPEPHLFCTTRVANFCGKAD